ncbi:MAG: LysE family transporter [Cyclobacteriaceae bacterium]|nr:MAG: LysE family transporter [Cyclobacteriaceae bacterium]
MEIVLKGIVSGLVLALLIGPVFFSIIQTSIERGFLSGVLVAVGVSLSDALYIFLAYMGLSQVFSNGDNQRYMAYFGGIILFAFGVYYLFIKSRRILDFKSVNIKSTSPWRLISKGFIINGLSPMVLIFWLGTVSVATGEFGYTTTTQVVTFFSAIVATVLLTDIIKAKLADKLRTVMTPRLVRVMNLILGVVMLIFAGRLLLYADNFNFH